MAGSSAMSLLVHFRFLVLAICNLLGNCQAQSNMNIEKDTVLKQLPLVWYPCLKGIGAQLGWPTSRGKVWYYAGGKLLLELNRLLRPRGYFVWSATPVYLGLPEDVAIWIAMSKLTKSCWELVVIKKDQLSGVGVAMYKKPTTNECYNPPLCKESDDAIAAWNVPLEACMHKVLGALKRGSRWPEQWQKRFAAALKDLKLWVMNVVPIVSEDTLPIIYERGLFGIYHDWSESFNTHPLT